MSGRTAKPGIFRRVFQAARMAAGLRAGKIPDPELRIGVPDGAILDHEMLAAVRAAETSTAGRLDPHQSKVPQYPPVSGRKIQRLGYLGNEVIRRAFDLQIESLTQAIPELQDASGKAVNGQAAADFNLLMACPDGEGSDLTGSDLWVRFWLDVLGTGNGMLEMVPGRGVNFPVRLERMDPCRTFIEPGQDDTTRINRYVYLLGGQFFTIPKERVLHFRLWDPLSDFWGIPRLFSALRSLATDTDLIDMFKVTFQNLGVPPVVLEYPFTEIVKGIEAGTLSLRPDKDHLEEIGATWDQKYSGKKRGKTAVAWGFNVKLIGLDFQKLAIGELVATTERRLLMTQGINPLLVGQSGTAQQKGHNFKEAREFFYASVLGGLWSQVADVFSARLARQFGGGMKFAFRTDHIDIIRESRLRRGKEAASVFVSGLLRRHACQRLIGEPADGDNIFYPDEYGASTAQTADGPEGESDE